MLKFMLNLPLILFVCSQSLFAADSKLGDSKLYFSGGHDGIEASEKYVIIPFNLYPRDTSFPLLHAPNKAQYVPRNIAKNKQSDNKLLYLPVLTSSYCIDKHGPDCKQAIINLMCRDDAGYGQGFIDKYHTIKFYFDSNNISYNKPGESIIEGGNIHFVDGKAIIGEDTLMINFLFMDEVSFEWAVEDDNTYYSENRLYYSVRNHWIAGGKLMSGSAENFRAKNKELFLKDLSDHEKSQYDLLAQEYAAKIEWVERQIAKDIFLARKDIIYVPNRKFHIDLDMTITHDNKILLRAPLDDDERVIYNLQLGILNKYFPGKVIEAPAQFSDPFIFNGITEIDSKEYYCCGQGNYLDQQFEGFMISHCGYQKVHLLNSSYWQERKKNSAGVHCVTQQYFKNPAL